MKKNNKKVLIKIGLSAMLLVGIFGVVHSGNASASTVDQGGKVTTLAGDPGGGTRPTDR